MSLPVCVIGAGSSGIAAVKALAQRGIPFDCFEKSDRVGGNWVFRNTNGMSSAYWSLHINTSRDRMAYSDFPMPSDYPDFPHHTQVAAYFDAYVDHFGLRERITFETGVERAQPQAGGWRVTLDTGEEREYRALLIANGHHWDPRWPEPAFPGADDFNGVQMHSHHYTGDDPELLTGKRVVVLGMGNSAMDIAVEATQVAERVFLAARRGAWIVPKYVFGRPLDQFVTAPRVPLKIRQRFMATTLRAAIGDMERYGLPKPDHRVLEAHPTISDSILTSLTHGDITPKPNIARLTEETVVFADGSEERADVVIYGTGYKVSFPFFDPSVVAAPDNELPLYKRVFHPDLPGLYFLALLQPLGATMPLAEAQSEWICDHLTGRYVLPGRREVLEDIARERAAIRRRYVASKRHTMQVDYDDYLFEVRRERRRGAGKSARVSR
ncbi:NAD(P)-binding domain-containing protein [Solirubrobacter ginsenosidimutans]|uniref:Flavin-containing monooxygenase 5 n=1 Tax=Solirubrobacter ginsenosidimutans TaxID=490573 RepID=A0A9X3N135_9ACTN|nr:NAD(P)-binding domain-containing protein [Solirubrobacter ginsenosidimutans]MDA0165123.1 NAD(P)-binding domain-containing protein [Solirubrobacter ginsenosidimutans]